MVARSLVACAVVMALMALVTRAWQVFALRAALGFLTGYGGLTLSMAAESAPRDRMAAAIGTVQTAQRLGPAVGPVIGGVLAGAVGLRRAFLVTALLFWWSLLRRSPGAAAGGLVLTMLHTSLLGALLALAPRVLYPAQTAAARLWGLSPLEDQQLAGLLMWVPAGTVYAGAALWFAARWIRGSGPNGRMSDAVAPA